MKKDQNVTGRSGSACVHLDGASALSRKRDDLSETVRQRDRSVVAATIDDDDLVEARILPQLQELLSDTALLVEDWDYNRDPWMDIQDRGSVSGQSSLDAQQQRSQRQEQEGGTMSHQDMSHIDGATV